MMRFFSIVVIVLFITSLLTSPLYGEEDIYDFDPSQLRKPFRINGYVESTSAVVHYRKDSVFNKLHSLEGIKNGTLLDEQLNLQLEAEYRKGIYKAYTRTMTGLRVSPRNPSSDFSLYEGYLSINPSPTLGIDAGKKTMRWGKGYAWNPVAFLDYPKDPFDPELPLKGLTVLTADFTRSFQGNLRTITFTPVLIPVYKGVNERFGDPGRVAAAAKLYLLLYDTDIDLVYASTGKDEQKYGASFSRNLVPEIAIHGEYAFVKNASRLRIDPSGNITRETRNAVSYLAGARYQTRFDTTFIMEYYRNNFGYTPGEMRNFYSLAEEAHTHWQTIGDPLPLQQASRLLNSTYASRTPMQSYCYLRVSKKDPFNMVYMTPAVTTMYNTADGSLSISPEIMYAPITNVEFRLKTVFNLGGNHSEFGSRPAAHRTELRIRYYF